MIDDLTGTLRIAGAVNDSIVDGPGIRYCLFVQGCPHACEGCHNPHTWAFDGGYERGLKDIFNEIISDPLLDGVTFSGGEPFCHAHKLYLLGRRLKEMELNIVTYTGYTFEQLVRQANDSNCFEELLSVTDILVDGRFVLAKRDLTLRFRGSSNQRLIDIPETIRTGRVVLWDT
ncbi:MAG: anaerobic ribonucleoside-triphosphate reductase activating protein [Oscillospiraceae bacterium]|nr:anaerobic ribonucleoside-triphosphate reductase activating protein [Oscillospiraceae bacterium]